MASGTLTTAAWTSTAEAGTEDETAQPAPTLRVLPARHRGWNRYAVPHALTDLEAYFADALIVWRGQAGYSANPVTAELIAGTPGTSALTELGANDEVWVKY